MEEQIEEVTFEEKITLFKRVRTLYETITKVVDNIVTSSPKEGNTISTPESVTPPTEEEEESSLTNS
jgi:hypothetical protein